MTEHLETVIIENPDFISEWQTYLKFNRYHPIPTKPINAPKGITPGTNKDIFKTYSRGLMKACADVLLCTELPSGKIATLALKRKPDSPYANTWYMPGGAVFAYQPLSKFLQAKTHKECGVEPKIGPLVGVYRNDAEDFPASVIAVCFTTFIHYSKLQEIKPADGHNDWQWITLNNLGAIPKNEQHWYPMHVWRKVLEASELD